MESALTLNKCIKKEREITYVCNQNQKKKQFIIQLKYLSLSSNAPQKSYFKNTVFLKYFECLWKVMPFYIDSSVL